MVALVSCDGSMSILLFGQVNFGDAELDEDIDNDAVGLLRLGQQELDEAGLLTLSQ